MNINKLYPAKLSLEMMEAIIEGLPLHLVERIADYSMSACPDNEEYAAMTFYAITNDCIDSSSFEVTEMLFDVAAAKA